MAAVVKCPKCRKQQSAARMTCAFCNSDLSQASSVPFWETYGGNEERVAANPIGTDLGVDGIKIRRPGGEDNPTAGALTQAFDRFKEHPTEAVFVYFFVALLAGNLTFTLDPNSQSTTYVAVVVGTIYAFKVVSWLARIPLEGGAATFWLRSWRDQEMEIGNLMVGLKYLKPLLIANVLCSAVIAAGTALLVVPGLILATRLSFVSMLIVDKNLSWRDAIKTSWEVTEGNSRELYKFVAILIGINIAGAVLCVFPVLVTVPVTYGALALVYNRMILPGNSYLEHDRHETEETEETEGGGD